MESGVQEAFGWRWMSGRCLIVFVEDRPIPVLISLLQDPTRPLYQVCASGSEEMTKKCNRLPTLRREYPSTFLAKQYGCLSQLGGRGGGGLIGIT